MNECPVSFSLIMGYFRSTDNWYYSIKQNNKSNLKNFINTLYTLVVFLKQTYRQISLNPTSQPVKRFLYFIRIIAVSSLIQSQLSLYSKLTNQKYPFRMKLSYLVVQIKSFNIKPLFRNKIVMINHKPYYKDIKYY